MFNCAVKGSEVDRLPKCARLPFFPGAGEQTEEGLLTQSSLYLYTFPRLEKNGKVSDLPKATLSVVESGLNPTVRRPPQGTEPH